MSDSEFDSSFEHIDSDAFSISSFEIVDKVRNIPRSSGNIESLKLQESSESSPNNDKEAPDPFELSSRPFLEEIVGCWKVISHQNPVDTSDSFIGRILEVDVANHIITASQCNKLGENVKLDNIFQIAQTHSGSSEYFYECVRNNQLIAVYTSNRFDKAWIQNGKLRLERNNGSIKMVLERVQYNSSLLPRLRNLPYFPTFHELLSKFF